MAPALKAENIGIEKATRIKTRGNAVRYKDKELDMGATLVDNDFFSMFNFPVIKGAAQNPLANLGDVVLPLETADKLFGKEEPIGKSIEVKMAGNWYKLVVSAIVADAPQNSSIRFSLLARSEADPDYTRLQNSWNNQHHPVYVQLAANSTRPQVESRLRSFTKKYMPFDPTELKKKGIKTDKNGDYISTRLLPLKDLHFDQRLGNGDPVSRPFLYILILISAVIILIASFNFINLNIGLSFTRSKEIGIRKCLGAGKRQVWLQVWGESLLLVLVAMSTAIVFVALVVRGFNKAFNAKLSMAALFSPGIIGILLALVVLVALLASGYPAAIMARLKTVEVLKGKISIKKPGLLRNSLIVAQFVIAIVLICNTLIIYQQFQHLRNAPLGYTTASIISIPIKGDNGKEIVAKMRTRLAAQSSVISVSGSGMNLGLGKDGSTSTIGTCFGYKEKTICGQVMIVDNEILKTLSITPTGGRDFSLDYSGDSSTAVILTESYARQFSEKNIVGLSFYSDSSRPKWNVVGIIPDFKLYSMYEKKEPLVLLMENDRSIAYVLVKVNTANPSATMKMISSVYAEVEPRVDFKGSYVDENIERWYKSEQRLAMLFSVAAMVAIVLSCMGLFGIAFIIIRQRVKEIGVRKVLGASVRSITTLVTQEFVRPVLVALPIAIPIAWLAMNKWLQNFTYRVAIHWWVFVVAGLTAMLIALATVGFQAIKAALANPVDSLRNE